VSDLLHDLARKRLYYLMHVASEANTACGWASGIETELPPIARATAAGHRPPQDDDGNDEWWVGDAEAVEMVRLADLLGLGNEWWVNDTDEVSLLVIEDGQCLGSAIDAAIRAAERAAERKEKS